jgi:hypothetical protein
MKKRIGIFSKMIYNEIIRIRSQHKDVLSVQSGGSVSHRLIAMDRLEHRFLAGNKCRMSAQAKDWLEAHFAK